jgi:predicted dithiol-disulfide oxidoreductase (DUF899 family)
VTATEEIAALEQEILASKKRLAELRRAQPRVEIPDLELDAPEGVVRILDLFAGKDDLILICNMGRDCSYCTLWADGFNGVVPELEDRAGFALVSADPIDVLAPFAQERNWRFRHVSDREGSFRRAVGSVDRYGGAYPGAIGLRREPDGRITMVAKAELGEGDDFCATWHLFDLLAEGWNGWEPKYRL